MTNLDYLYDKDDAAKYFGKNHFVDKKLHFRIIEGGTVLPHKPMNINGKPNISFGGLVDNKGEFIKSSALYRSLGAAYTPTEEIQHVRKTVVYLGLLCTVWGHALTDNLKFLWFLTNDVFKRYFKDCEQIYIPWSNGGVLHQQKNFRRLLEVLDVDVDKLQPVTQPTQFENVILPDESFFSANKGIFFTGEYRDTIDRIRDFALKNQTPSANKVYYFYGRWQIGEERLAEYFRSKGYEIISPENLTFDEQLNLLINAESFASTLGSCSHNSIFLRDGTEVIMIPRTANRFTGYQQTLDKVHELNSNYVDSTLSIFAPDYHGPYCYVISRQLKEFFGDDFNGYTDDDFKIFLTYARACMRQGFKQNDSATKYYGAMLQEFWPQLKARPDLTDSYGVKLS